MNIGKRVFEILNNGGGRIPASEAKIGYVKNVVVQYNAFFGKNWRVEAKGEEYVFCLPGERRIDIAKKIVAEELSGRSIDDLVIKLAEMCGISLSDDKTDLI